MNMYMKEMESLLIIRFKNKLSAHQPNLTLSSEANLDISSMKTENIQVQLHTVAVLTPLIVQQVRI